MTALLIAAGALAAIMLSPMAALFPVMIVLGPLMVGQYGYWTWRLGPERTTAQYLQAEPLRG